MYFLSIISFVIVTTLCKAFDQNYLIQDLIDTNTDYLDFTSNENGGKSLRYNNYYFLKRNGRRFCVRACYRALDTLCYEYRRCRRKLKRRMRRECSSECSKYFWYGREEK